jgi:adenylate cyclase
VEAGVRNCCVLIVDIAGSVRLRERIGDTAAERRIRHLIDGMIAAARERGGEFIKSYGDDVMSIFDQDPINSAARTAVICQRMAATTGLELYAGMHFGPVEFRETMGHPDAVGQTVSIAARLHKLTEGAPGRIFLAEQAVQQLSVDLRTRANLFGTRELKGIEPINVWTLDWHDAAASTETQMAPMMPPTDPFAALKLRYGGSEVMLAERKAYLVGRGKECILRIFDPENRISTTHLQIEYNAGCWFAHDISRNGTWLRDSKTSEVRLLPYCTKAMLPTAGELCLGRAFTDDAEGLFTLAFEPVAN